MQMDVSEFELPPLLSIQADQEVTRLSQMHTVPVGEQGDSSKRRLKHPADNFASISPCCPSGFQYCFASEDKSGETGGGASAGGGVSK